MTYAMLSHGLLLRICVLLSCLCAQYQQCDYKASNNYIMHIVYVFLFAPTLTDFRFLSFLPVSSLDIYLSTNIYIYSNVSQYNKVGVMTYSYRFLGK